MKSKVEKWSSIVTLHKWLFVFKHVDSAIIHIHILEYCEKSARPGDHVSFGRACLPYFISVLLFLLSLT
jgi:hypothetical protein